MQPINYKLEARAKPMIMVRYCHESYRLRNPYENKIDSSRPVIFDETSLRSDELGLPSKKDHDLCLVRLGRFYTLGDA